MINYKPTVRACYVGYITQAIVNNLAPLLFIVFQQEFQISYSQISQLILANFAVQFLADIAAVRFVDRIGYRVSAVGAHFLCAAGLILLGILPRLLGSPFAGLLISVAVYALGGGLLEVLVSPIVDAVPGDAKASAMSLLHSFYCWGQMGVVLISTLVLKAVGFSHWVWLPVGWAVIPLFNGLRFCKVPLAPIVPEGEQTSLGSLLRTSGFWMMLLLMLCAGASELTMSQWASLFAEQGLGVSKVLGDLLGPCMFALFMGLGRMGYGFWGARLSLKKALLACGGLCAACYIVTVFSKNPLVALLACGLSGLSVSLMWPGTFSLCSARYPKGGTAMFGSLAIAGDIGCAAGPWLAGFASQWGAKNNPLFAGQTAQQAGLKSGILAGCVFPLILTTALLLWRKTPSIKKQ